MHIYHVTFYYLATGMEGIPDIQDYGYINAWSYKEAIEKAALQAHPKMSERDLKWMESCLSAQLVWIDKSGIKDI